MLTLRPRHWATLALVSSLIPAAASAAAEPPPIRPVRAGGLAADVAAIILSGQQGGDLPLAAIAAPYPRPEGGLTVPVSIEIDAGILFDYDAGVGLDGENRGPEKLEIVAYSLGEDGISIQDSLIQAYEIDPDRLASSRRGLRFVAEVGMPRPPGTVRVLARLRQREALGVLSLSVDGEANLAAAPSTLIATSSETEGETDGGVDETSTAPPSDAADGPRLTPPLVAGGDGWLHLPWILPTGRLRPEPEPFASEAVASKAVVMRGEPLSFRILADDLEAVGSRITLELHGGDGRLSAQVPADVKSYSTPDADGRREILVQAPTADFPLGGFALAAVLGEADAPRTPPLPVLILDDYSFGADGADGEPSSWPWLVARLTAPQAPTLASGRTENSAAVDRRELVSGLDEVYDLLTDSEDSAARRRHLRLAMAVAKDHGSIGLKAMGKEEFERARRLAELTAQESEAGARANPRNAEAVLPLVSLNLELYREARRLGRTLVSTHARFMAMRLIELYLAQAGNSTVAKKTAASLFVSLGGELQLADMVYFSERIFRKALSFDERQATALLALGMNYHLIGDLQRARDSFQTLLEIDPSHTEGSLRLARLDLLEGQERRARKRLQQAIKSSGPEWALAVAYQELARLDIDEGELLAAKKTLSEGLGRFPNQPRLLMLMAFAHDASAANTRAREVLAKAGAETSGRPSPRRRFVDWSRESFVRNDRLMQEKVHRAVPVLTERWRKVRHHNAQVQAQGDNR